MTQDRLESLIIISVEKDILEKIKTKDYVDKFAEKIRRINL